MASGPAFAQAMSYSESYQASPDFVEDVTPRADDSILDLGMQSGIMGDTFASWSRKHRPLFELNDVNHDKVLNERDLINPSPESSVLWARGAVEQILSVWMPDMDAHVAKLYAKIDRNVASDPMLKDTATAKDSLENLFSSLGLTGGTWTNGYIKAVAGEGAMVNSAGVVRDLSRAWVTVDVPVSLNIHDSAGVKTYDYVITVLGMKKFRESMEGESFAIWDIGVKAN
jgi:hypothetical protein